MDLPNTRLWRDDPRPMASSPLIVIPVASSVPSCSERVKVWPGKGGECGKIGATVNLVRAPALRREQKRESGRRNGVEVEQRNRRRRKKDEPRCRNCVAARMLAESPTVTLYTRGFSRFVTSTTAPIATGRSESCRVGLSPTG